VWVNLGAAHGPGDDKYCLQTRRSTLLNHDSSGSCEAPKRACNLARQSSPPCGPDESSSASPTTHLPGLVRTARRGFAGAGERTDSNAFRAAWRTSSTGSSVSAGISSSEAVSRRRPSARAAPARVSGSLGLADVDRPIQRQWDRLEHARQGAMYAYLTTLPDALQAKDAWQEIRT
jgi:hypothetical protein